LIVKQALEIRVQEMDHQPEVACQKREIKGNLLAVDHMASTKRRVLTVLFTKGHLMVGEEVLMMHTL
jgi:hypothetical protein